MVDTFSGHYDLPKLFNPQSPSCIYLCSQRFLRSLRSFLIPAPPAQTSNFTVGFVFGKIFSTVAFLGMP